jgi:hypothetical protein
METDPNIVQGKEYNCSVIVTYKDNQGNMAYESHCIKEIQLMVEYEGKTAEQIREESIKTEKETLDISLLTFALLMLIGLIVIGVVLGGIFKRIGSGKSKEDDKLPQIQPPAIPQQPQPHGPRVVRTTQQYPAQQYNQQQQGKGDQEVFY